MHDATRLCRAVQGRGKGTAVLSAWLLALITLAGCSRDAERQEPRADYKAEVVNPDFSGGMLLPDGKTLLVWGTDGSLLRSEDGARWSIVETTNPADLASAAVDSTGKVLIAVGKQGTILRSVDGGRSFRAATNDTTDTDLRSVAWHAASSAWIAAGTGGRILRSRDDGKTWSVVPSSAAVDFHALFVDPKTRDVLIGGDLGTVGVSSDGGASFHVTTLAMPDPASPVTKFFRHGELLLGTSSLGRLITSNDDAKNWQLKQTATAAVFIDSAADPAHHSIVVTGHDGTLLRSVDGGATWVGLQVTTNGRAHYMSAVNFDAARGFLIAVGHNGSIARSDNGGAGWISWSIGTLELRGVIADAKGAPLVAYGPGGLLMNSEDGGGNWRAAKPALEVSLRDVAHAPQGRALIASGKLGAVVRSTDGGASWSSVEPVWPNPNTPPELRMLVETPARDALLGVGPPGTIVRSNADGSVWSVKHFTPIESERAFTWALVEPKRATLTAIEARGQMQLSSDSGITWRAVDAPTNNADWVFWQGALLDSGTLIVAGKSGTAIRSTDGGATWTAMLTGTDKDLFGSFADRDLSFLVGQDGTLLRSADDGATWSAVNSTSDKELRRMLRDPASDRLVCFGAHGAMVRSDDRGLTWQAVKTDTDGALRKGIVDPKSGEMFIAGSRGAILRSRDGGLSWDLLPSHTKRHFQSLAIDDNGDLVVVGERIVRLVRQTKS
jgi:photosystem II stability/assembly factor-like uncharacterized protein